MVGVNSVLTCLKYQESLKSYVFIASFPVQMNQRTDALEMRALLLLPDDTDQSATNSKGDCVDVVNAVNTHIGRKPPHFLIGGNAVRHAGTDDN